MNSNMYENSFSSLLAILPKELNEASAYCAMPHWFDNRLGLEIINRFVTHNGRSRWIFGELTHLPFIYPREEGTWQYTDISRSFLRSRLMEKDDAFVAVSNFLFEWFKLKREEIEKPEDWRARQLDWQIAFHLVPVNPRLAVDHLFEIAERAAQFHLLPELKLAMDVCREQSDWLRKYLVDAVYFEGRYAYSQGNDKLAEEKFTYVWTRRAQNPLITANAGHLLGVIWRHRGRSDWLKKAKEILWASLAICRGVNGDNAKHLTAQILNSLGATLIQFRDPESLALAERLLHQSLRIGEDLENERHVAHVLNSLGTLLIQREDQRYFPEAESLLRRSLEISERIRHPRGVAQTLHTLAKLEFECGDSKSLEQAEEHLRGSLEIGRHLGDRQHIALVLNTLGMVLLQLYGRQAHSEAKKSFQESLEIWRDLDNAKGQVESLQNLATVLTQMGRTDEAQQLLMRAEGIER